MTSNDPWEIETPPAPPAGGTPVAAPKAAVTREQAPANEGVTVTLKGGKGYEAPWIVIHAADPASALAQLHDPLLKDLVERTAKVGSIFAGTGAHTPAAGPSGPAPSAPTGSAKPAYQQAPGGSQSCAHGEMVFKSGVNAQGKAWSGNFCPERDKAQQCPPKWNR